MTGITKKASMKHQTRFLAGTVTAGLLISFFPGFAMAKDNQDDTLTMPVVDLSTPAYEIQADKAIKAWETTEKTTILPTHSGRSKTVRAYRGSFLMWAEEAVSFNYNGSRVTWSSGYQKSGAVFPNNVTQNGTSRIYSSGWNHRWRGSYTVGAGVPTPWGNANVYNMTSVITTNVYGNGGYSYYWDN